MTSPHTHSQTMKGFIDAIGEKESSSGDSKSSSSSEQDWEDIDLSVEKPVQISDKVDVNLNRKNDESKSKKRKRKSSSKENKALGYYMHLIHTQYLLYHGYLINDWLNDKNLQLALKKQIPKELRKESKKYHNRPEKNVDLYDLLDRLVVYFSRRFKQQDVTITSFKQYKHTVLRFVGSKDIGAQSFTCILRGLGFQATLIYSLPVMMAMRSTNNTPRFWSVVTDANKTFIIDPMILRQVVYDTNQFHPQHYVVGYNKDSSTQNLTLNYLHKSQLGPGYVQFQEYMNLLYTRQKNSPVVYPESISAYKSHPKFILKSQLHKNQVPLGPPVHTFKVKARRETVYLKSQITTRRSEFAWFKRGRKITIESSDDALYRFDQTEPFKHPPVENDKIPKNKYGSIEIFNPYMIPEGGAHLIHHDALYTAKKLKLDYARAVVGYKKGGVNFNGIVVSQRNEQLISDQLKERDLERIYHKWRLYLSKLRLLRRLNSI